MYILLCKRSNVLSAFESIYICWYPFISRDNGSACLVKLFWALPGLWLDWPLQGVGLVDVIRRLRPYSQVNTVHCIWGWLPVGVSGRLSVLTDTDTWQSIVFGVKQRGFIIRVLLFLNKLFPRVNDLHAPKAVDGASMAHHRSFSSLDLDFSRHMPLEHFINSGSFFPPTPLRLWQPLGNI